MNTFILVAILLNMQGGIVGHAAYPAADREECQAIAQKVLDAGKNGVQPEGTALSFTCLEGGKIEQEKKGTEL